MPHEGIVVEDRQVLTHFHRQATLIESVNRWFVLVADRSNVARQETLSLGRVSGFCRYANAKRESSEEIVV